jgi:hypothetical protein
LLVLAFIAAIGCIAYAPLWGLAFWGDDWFLLSQGSGQGFISLALGKGARHLSQFTYVPLLGPSFRLDWLILGENFRWYNCGNLAWFVLTGCAAFALLRTLGSHRFWAAVGGVLVLCNPATLAVSGLCATRHYVFGLFFALCAASLFVAWLRGAGERLLILSAVLYFLAIMSKEVYSPLVIFVPLLAPAEKRFRALRAFGAAVLVYLVLRSIFLHGLVGGYDTSYHPATLLGTLGRGFPRIAETLVYGGHVPGKTHPVAASVGSVILILTLILPAIAWGKTWASLLTGLLLSIETLTVLPIMSAPLIAYANDPLHCHSDRLVMPLTVTAWLLLVAAVSTWEKRLGKAAVTGLRILGGAGCVALFFAGAMTKPAGWALEKPSWNQIAFVKEHLHQRNVFVSPPTWCLWGLPALRQQHGQQFPGTVVGNPEQRPDWTNIVRGYRLGPQGTIESTTEPTVADAWMEAYREEFKRVLPIQWNLIRARSRQPQPPPPTERRSP